MIVADTSSLISLASIDLLDTLLTEFNIHTTELVIEELEETSDYDDRHGEAAQKVLDQQNQITVHNVQGELTSSRIDQGEGSCAKLTKEIDAEFLITDDLQALPELQTLTNSKVAISPIILKALVTRNVLKHGEALDKLEELGERRDWLGAPIYRRATNLFQ